MAGHNNKSHKDRTLHEEKKSGKNLATTSLCSLAARLNSMAITSPQLTAH